MSFYDNELGGDQSTEIYPGIRVTLASRQKGVVCGSPHGDCVSKNYEGPNHIVTLGKDDTLAETDMYEVQEDVFEERLISGTTKSKFLVARKGQSITKKKATELGII